MTEFENWQLLKGAVANMIEQREVLVEELTAFVTLLFSYVVATYLAGASLKRSHVIIGTTLYIGAMVVFQSAIIQSLFVYAEITDVVMRYRAEVGLPLARGAWYTENTGANLAMVAVYNVAMTCGSLYYMWSTRRPLRQVERIP